MSAYLVKGGAKFLGGILHKLNPGQQKKKLALMHLVPVFPKKVRKPQWAGPSSSTFFLSFSYPPRLQYFQAIVHVSTHTHQLFRTGSRLAAATAAPTATDARAPSRRLFLASPFMNGAPL